MGAPQYEQAGADIGGTGTTDTIPRWTGPSTLGDSPLTVSGNNVTGAGAIRATGTAASAPAFTGSDTDTGMYFPAANQVRFATAGSLAIAIDASQNVGIGTASPVNHGAGAVTLAVNGTSLAMIDWMVNGTRTMAGFAQSSISQFGTVTATPLAFLTGNAERARISGTTAQVAIGTTSFTSGCALTTVADIDVYGVRVGRGAGAGSANTCVGSGAMGAITTANSSVAVGDNALGSATTGGGNTAVGSEANRYNTTGAYNTGIGYFALRGAAGVTTGTSNTATGFQAGQAITTGSNNVIAGFQAGDGITTGNSNIVIGSGADVAAATDSNKLVIGDATNYVATNGGATTYYATAGALAGYIIVRLNGTDVKLPVYAL